MKTTYTEAEIAAGFRAWARDRRENPDKFLTYGDAAAMSEQDRAWADTDALVRYMNPADTAAAVEPQAQLMDEGERP